MSLNDYKVQLLLYGINLKLSPSVTLTPAIPSGAMPMFALRCPAIAVASMQEADGVDPTNPDTPLEQLLDALMLRRVLDNLRLAGDITAWTLVLSAGVYYIQILCTPAQCTSWYQWQDWVLSSLKPEAAKTTQRYFIF